MGGGRRVRVAALGDSGRSERGWLGEGRCSRGRGEAKLVRIWLLKPFIRSIALTQSNEHGAALLVQVAASCAGRVIAEENATEPATDAAADRRRPRPRHTRASTFELGKHSQMCESLWSRLGSVAPPSCRRHALVSHGEGTVRARHRSFHNCAKSLFRGWLGLVPLCVTWSNHSSLLLQLNFRATALHSA